MKPKLYLINGPLGAGKTTFLRELLQQSAFQNARVIENEFASTSVDTQQLHDHQAEVKTIAGLCICCSTGEELTDALMSLADSAEPVIIESTGVANSLKLIEKLVVGDIFDHYELGYGVFILDAAEAVVDDAVLNRHETELQAADMVLLSKVDLISDAQQKALQQQLQTMKVIRTQSVNDGKTDGEFLQQPSQMLHYFATFNGQVENHDGDVNYTIVDMQNVAVDSEKMPQIWENLRDDYQLRRMKGDVADAAGKKWHIEATPAQCRVIEGQENKPQLVLIGQKAREITQQTMKEYVKDVK